MPTITINVSNAVQLATAIRSATGGETILLAAGDYGSVSIKGRMLADTVTIKSADADNDARFSDLRIDRSSGFRIEDVDLNRPLEAGEANFTQATYISSSSNIHLAGMDFRGSMDGIATNDGTALRVTGSSGVTVIDSTFEQWSQAGIFSGSQELTLSGNSVTGVVRTFSFTSMLDSTVSNNSFVGVEPEWSETTPGVSFDANSVSGIVVPVVESGIGKVLSVASRAELTDAVGKITGGETILLAPGNYGTLNLINKAMLAPVTIKSADGANDAVFANIRIANSNGFVFSDIDVHRPLAAGEGDWTQAVYISSSQAIDFIGVDFYGSLDNNPWNDGLGLRVANTQEFRLVDSTFEQWTNAVTFEQVDRLAVIGNTIFDVREGLNFAAVHDVTIAQNLLYGFDPNYAKGDHADAIQFWSTGVAEGSSDVVIRDNIMLQGANGGIQGILIGAQVATARNSNFLIENNLYNGDARHGITINGTDGVVIRGNTVTSAPGGMLEAGININRSTGVLVEKNITPLLLQDANNLDVTLRDNIDLYDTKQKLGLQMAEVFETSSGDLFDPGSFVAKGEAGFHGFEGIGAASFELSGFTGNIEVGALFGTLLIA